VVGIALALLGLSNEPWFQWSQVRSCVGLLCALSDMLLTGPAGSGHEPAHRCALLLAGAHAFRASWPGRSEPLAVCCKHFGGCHCCGCGCGKGRGIRCLLGVGSVQQRRRRQQRASHSRRGARTRGSCPPLSGVGWAQGRVCVRPGHGGCFPHRRGRGTCPRQLAARSRLCRPCRAAAKLCRLACHQPQRHCCSQCDRQRCARSARPEPRGSPAARSE
jgi:hypothetical protein